MKALCLLLLLIPLWGHCQVSEQPIASSWMQSKADRTGTIICYWHDTQPFVYQQNDTLIGVEAELIASFVAFTEKSYGVNLEVQWVRGDSFDGVYDQVKNSENGVFGLSAYSITAQRKKEVSFAPAYMPDISVVVSNREMPLVEELSAFNEAIDNGTAITLKRSTFEQMLIALKEENALHFEIKHIPSSGDIINTVAQTDNGFRYIDLPTYLGALQRGVPIRRQYLYTQQLEGLSLLYALNSDWQEPIITYFSSMQFQLDKARIVSKYFGAEVQNLMQRISTNQQYGSSEEVFVLQKEKQIQNQELLLAEAQAEKDRMIMNSLLVGVVIVLVIVFLIFNRYQIKSKANKSLALKQEEIKKKNRKLTKLDKEKDNLIHMLAHDLRSPINQISGLAEIVKHDGNKLAENQSEVLNKIISTSTRVNAMVSRILDLEGLKNNKIELNIEAVELKEMLQNIIDTFAQRAGEKNIQLVSTIENPLPLVKADAMYITQVFENLVSNAIKFSGENTTVEVSAEVEEKTIAVNVKDQGPGISEEEQKKLFKKFQKLSARPTGGEQSTGLGLSIVKQYVKAMGGKVWCRSWVGEGSTFTVRLKQA